MTLEIQREARTEGSGGSGRARQHARAAVAQALEGVVSGLAGEDTKLVGLANIDGAY